MCIFVWIVGVANILIVIQTKRVARKGMWSVARLLQEKIEVKVLEKEKLDMVYLATLILCFEIRIRVWFYDSIIWIMLNDQDLELYGNFNSSYLIFVFHYLCHN